uniref:Uncharacterized protein n=1 Tax=Lygus hesperus TaxID=30085 RepID=A0A146KTD1_LYGHE
MRPPPIWIVIGVILTIALGVQSARRPRVVSLPMPTSETIPYVAEVMGATSYEEVVEEEDKYVNGNKRVQRKLNLQAEGERELDPEHPEYQEYQGNKTSTTTITLTY